MEVFQLLTIKKINAFEKILQEFTNHSIIYKLTWQYQEDFLELTMTNGHSVIVHAVAYEELDLANFNLLEYQIKSLRNDFKDGDLE